MTKTLLEQNILRAMAKETDYEQVVRLLKILKSIERSY